MKDLRPEDIVIGKTKVKCKLTKKIYTVIDITSEKVKNGGYKLFLERQTRGELVTTLRLFRMVELYKDPEEKLEEILTRLVLTSNCGYCFDPAQEGSEECQGSCNECRIQTAKKQIMEEINNG
jgi:hypothetical protein